MYEDLEGFVFVSDCRERRGEIREGTVEFVLAFPFKSNENMFLDSSESTMGAQVQWTQGADAPWARWRDMMPYVQSGGG